MPKLAYLDTVAYGFVPVKITKEVKMPTGLTLCDVMVTANRGVRAGFKGHKLGGLLYRKGQQFSISKSMLVPRCAVTRTGKLRDFKWPK